MKEETPLLLQDWLLRSRDRLVADLHPEDVIDQLTGPGLLSEAEEAEIDQLETRQAKVRRLVRLIAARRDGSEELLAAFHTALKADYPWLTIRPDVGLRRSGGDFEARVDGGDTAVPQNVACAFQIQPLQIPTFGQIDQAASQFQRNELVISPPIAALLGVESVPSWAQPIRRGGSESVDFDSPPLIGRPVPLLTHAQIDQVASNAIALDSWRGIARDLGVTEDDIASVQSRHPFDLRAQCYEVLRVWSADYEGASLSVLVSALRKNRLNRLAARLVSGTVASS